jgi:hypothetical protein
MLIQLSDAGGKLSEVKRQLLEGHCISHPPFADLLMARAIKNAVSQEL